MDLFIVYGSETPLLEPLYKRKNSLFIRIYNSSRGDDKRSIYINTIDELKETLPLILKNENVDRIIFIGAAFLTQTTLLINTSSQEIENSLEVNIKNYVNYVSLILPYMLSVRKGNFIYLSSFRSQVTSRGISLYAASKAFGEKFFEVLGKEYGALGVYSSSIRMGYFDGRMTNDLDEEKRKKIKLNAGNRKLGTAEDLYRAIDYLLNSPYSNGGVIDLTGGINHEY